LVPNAQEKVWFIVEEDQMPFYPIYDATPAAIAKIIPECYGFEYYLVPKDKNWIFCENHHDRLIAVGEPVETAIRAITTI
jgi:hypothetical protein